MTPEVKDLIVGCDTSLREALVPLDRSGTGFLMVTDAMGRLAGVITDGDIRRAILKGVAFDVPVSGVMTSPCVSLPVDSSSIEINRALAGRIGFIPLLDGDGRPVDYASLTHHRRYPVMEPLLDGNELAYVEECVRTGWISSQGRFVGEFERRIAEFHGVPHALAVSSGTTALHLALVSLGVGPGDEVIVPDLTFAASASAVIHAGAAPVLVDVEPASWTLDPVLVERALTSRTRAIMAVHLYGQPGALEQLAAFAHSRGLLLIEDAAEAFGARAGGRLVGTFGDAAAFSFFGNKTVTTGEGGVVLFRDAEVHARARMLRDHGMAPARRYWHLEAGYNYRLTNLQAAVGVAQMERVDAILEKKRLLGRAYDAALRGIPGISLADHSAGTEPVCWLYTLRVEDGLGITRDELAAKLLLNGIETRPVFFPLHEMPPFRAYARSGSYPVAERVAATGLSLPSAVTLRPEDIDVVTSTIRTILGVRGLAVRAGALK